MFRALLLRRGFTPEPISASCACGKKKKKSHVKYSSSTVALELRVTQEESSGARAAMASDGIADERVVLLAQGIGVSARHFLRLQSCKREKRRAGGPLVMVHAQKVCRRPQTGGPGRSSGRQGCVLHQVGEMSQQEVGKHNTHRDNKKMGPGSSQGAWLEIKGHKNWREVQPVSNHEDRPAPAGQRGCSLSFIQLNKAVRNTCCSHSWPCFQQEPGAETEVPSNISYPLILQHPVLEETGRNPFSGAAHLLVMKS